ncbi:hypothetical protein NUH30_06525 [Leptospira sp. 85282-16]|uniref:Uncharacterized protein n=1 Tax=Leptospira montravelensis TaxID=2484961 RepID=A0ABY2LL99_9LEPT|nr:MULTISPECIES: hypothetical protein [Leptospira]MCT8333320.1 hypothetical protein [Leptospira sp. 85282-16]TGK79767.1 hypothetical protein EHQ19_08530 [Leptospira montravelensis]TGK99931.1 hypothetical protein EHQ31_13950 [Leptospira montravelensis]
MIKNQFLIYQSLKRIAITFFLLSILQLQIYCNQTENWVESDNQNIKFPFKNCLNLTSDQKTFFNQNSKSKIKIWDNQNNELIVSAIFNTQGKEKEFINLKINRNNIPLYSNEAWNFPGQLTSIYFECPSIYFHTSCFKWNGKVGYSRNRINILNGKKENNGLCI